MRKQGRGAIVNCSSLGGLVGLPGRAAYHASKHGVIGLTKSAALDYAAKGIRVNAVCPGCIDTPMGYGIDPAAMKAFLRDQPIGRMAVPKKSQLLCCGFAARAQALCLASHCRSMAASSPIDPAKCR